MNDRGLTERLLQTVRHLRPHCALGDVVDAGNAITFSLLLIQSGADCKMHFVSVNTPNSVEHNTCERGMAATTMANESLGGFFSTPAFCAFSCRRRLIDSDGR